ncbi:MAG: hypothetical protein V4510_09980 [bacterium]
MTPNTSVCFLLEDMRRARYSLRRYSEARCVLSPGYHNARSVVIEERPEDPAKDYTGSNPPEVARADPRWPKRCACGYAFEAADQWQVWADGLYRHDTGAVFTWDEAPAGAVRDASWWPDKGADGHAWAVKLPDGSDWMTEGKANNCACPSDPAHRCWKRSGAPPNLTVSPSIATSRWHGWLREWRLVAA